MNNGRLSGSAVAASRDGAGPRLALGAANLLSLPDAGQYAMIAADPPWHFRARTALQMSDWTCRRDAEKHYSVMGVDDIAALPVKQIAAKDAHLMMWITGPLFVEGKHLPIMEAWGFRPSSVAFVWVKLKRSVDARQLRVVPTMESDLHVGLGLTTRHNAEFVVLGRRGNAKRISKSVREIILSPVREHSRKPDEFYARVQQYAAGPYLDMFSRQQRPGWDAWGLEVDKFSPKPATGHPVGNSTKLGRGSVPLQVITAPADQGDVSSDIPLIGPEPVDAG